MGCRLQNPDKEKCYLSHPSHKNGTGSQKNSKLKQWCQHFNLFNSLRTTGAIFLYGFLCRYSFVFLSLGLHHCYYIITRSYLFVIKAAVGLILLILLIYDDSIIYFKLNVPYIIISIEKLIFYLFVCDVAY